MDYKYIKQLLERYWRCETSLEEEKILRTFFSQKDVPAELLPYKPLFEYEQEETTADVLGDDFDQMILSKVEEEKPVKARVITMHQRLMPLFKAAAVVAILLTLGNAVQSSFDVQKTPTENVANVQKPKDGPSVAKIDSMTNSDSAIISKSTPVTAVK
ncbi:hypothetical protein PRLR6025_17550 [Prevotella lacticifex]|uniref:pyruvate ferredoxin oxidoreductase n=1 Tax=Prevotella lacticifex TaxID=2854755 RepID=UPI001CC6B8CA|nr:pyruvate ferredoxin oxidoreductase [Prevotella lacticifex]GJG68286.1 hypothetical protein PRLR6025_17550 [Prevotella lacticifex]